MFSLNILVRIASYGPQIDQSHDENRLSHIIMINIIMMMMMITMMMIVIMMIVMMMMTMMTMFMKKITLLGMARKLRKFLSILN